jgi:hypothetical protein
VIVRYFPGRVVTLPAVEFARGCDRARRGNDRLTPGTHGGGARGGKRYTGGSAGVGAVKLCGRQGG